MAVSLLRWSASGAYLEAFHSVERCRLGSGPYFVRYVSGDESCTKPYWFDDLTVSNRVRCPFDSIPVSLIGDSQQCGRSVLHYWRQSG